MESQQGQQREERQHYDTYFSDASSESEVWQDDSLSPEGAFSGTTANDEGDIPLARSDGLFPKQGSSIVVSAGDPPREQHAALTDSKFECLCMKHEDAFSRAHREVLTDISQLRSAMASSAKVATAVVTRLETENAELQSQVCAQALEIAEMQTSVAHLTAKLDAEVTPKKQVLEAAGKLHQQLNGQAEMLAQIGPLLEQVDAAHASRQDLERAVVTWMTQQADSVDALYQGQDRLFRVLQDLHVRLASLSLLASQRLPNMQSVTPAAACPTAVTGLVPLTAPPPVCQNAGQEALMANLETSLLRAKRNMDHLQEQVLACTDKVAALSEDMWRQAVAAEETHRSSKAVAVALRGLRGLQAVRAASQNSGAPAVTVSSAIEALEEDVRSLQATNESWAESLSASGAAAKILAASSTSLGLPIVGHKEPMDTASGNFVSKAASCGSMAPDDRLRHNEGWLQDLDVRLDRRMLAATSMYSGEVRDNAWKPDASAKQGCV